ncbi:MAG: H-NS family nucleoid-associated regulatory protein [Pseudomonadota bacterium]
MASTAKLLKEMSLDEMLTLRTEIDERVATMAADEVAELENRLQKLKGYVGAQPKAAAAASPKPQATKEAKSPKRATKAKAAAGKRGPKKGTRVEPKFVDKASGKSWTGRGLTPLWIKEHEAKGGSRDDFAVKS